MNNFNEIAETEVPTQAVQSRLAQTFWALKMELVDRSIDRGIFENDASFAQENSCAAFPFQSRLRPLKSYMKCRKTDHSSRVSD